MHARLVGLATAFVLATALSPGIADAAPRGWECSYAITPLGPNSTTTYYTCSGSSLTQTRARARARCRRLNWCVTGSCLPLKFTPRRRCGR